MSLNDPMANALSRIVNCEKKGMKTCFLKPVSKVMKKILEIMKDHQYIGSFKEREDGRGGYIEVQLLGHINKCGVIKPRFAVKKEAFEKFEKRYLLAKDFGILLVSTPKGIMSHQEAKEKDMGGRLLSYCY